MPAQVREYLSRKAGRLHPCLNDCYGTHV
ncbi:hypothetical protein MTBLM1_40152 [Rhodospirillaceae bacterium LM-1]|nr:hypothetical protein MTBLM1_40152 [Rhodospirillaceae bacterium LM-1]